MIKTDLFEWSADFVIGQQMLLDSQELPWDGQEMSLDGQEMSFGGQGMPIRCF